MGFSFRRIARQVKRVGRLLTGRDVLYHYDFRPQKVTLGTVYGGWTIAPEFLVPKGVVYSFGVGNEISFDEALIQRYGLEVHGFDPSPHVISWVNSRKLPPKYFFHPFGLAAADGFISFFAPAEKRSMYSTRSGHANVGQVAKLLPVKTLKSIIGELDTTSIEVLKIDIEGTEYDILPSIVDCDVPIKQLLIEFHHRIGIESLGATIKAVDRLRDCGYLLFHVAETSSEFSFLNSRLVSDR